MTYEVIYSEWRGQYYDSALFVVYNVNKEKTTATARKHLLRQMISFIAVHPLSFLMDCIGAWYMSEYPNVCREKLVIGKLCPRTTSIECLSLVAHHSCQLC